MSDVGKLNNRLDVPTLIAIAVVAYAFINVAHEGLGHGGACFAFGGEVRALHAVYFECGKERLTAGSAKWISAWGTLVNLVIGALAWLALRLTGRAATAGRYCVWLVMSLSLLQATGYWLFSGLLNVGDWAKVIENLNPGWAYRSALTLAGGIGYYLVIRLSLRTLLPFLGTGEDRVQRARQLTVIPYFAGGILYVAAGLLNPIGFELVLISAAAASFGGTSAFAWMNGMLNDRAAYPVQQGQPLLLRRSIPWLITGATVAAFFIGVLGRTVRFH